MKKFLTAAAALTIGITAASAQTGFWQGVPYYSDYLIFRDLRDWAGVIVGLPESPVIDIILKNIDIQAKKGLQIGYATVELDHVDIGTLKNCQSWAMETSLLIRSPVGTGRHVEFPDPRADAAHQIGETRLNNLQGEAKAA